MPHIPAFGKYKVKIGAILCLMCGFEVFVMKNATKAPM